MRVIGLTGSIGMGKSTIARQARILGAKTISADDLVHQLLREKDIIKAIAKEFPTVIMQDEINRQALGKIIFHDDAARLWLENLLHPRVKRLEEIFVYRMKLLGAKRVVLDIPLLYETGGNRRFKEIIVATASRQAQVSRVLKRPGMTADKYKQILMRQLPDPVKRRRANFIIFTGLGKAYAMRQLKAILA